jgi:predicted ATPase
LPERDLDNALARLVNAELIWRRGSPPDAEYTFKHALVQDAAYGTLLREPRRALHARIAKVLESNFADITESQPELLAHHHTEAGQIERAASLWGKAGQLSLTGSALKEAAAQLTRALSQIETLPSTAALRRDQIRLQISLANALMHTEGYAARETRAALDQVRALVERAEVLGEKPEDPTLLWSVMHGFWVANHVGFNGDAVRELAEQFLVLAKKQSTALPLVVAHRIMGTSLLYLGDIQDGRTHFDQAMALYDPPGHRPLATRFGQDIGVAILANRPLALWLLGYPEAARQDSIDAVRYAREMGHAGSFMYALTRIASFHLVTGDFTVAAQHAQALIAIAEEKDGAYWKAAGMMIEGCLLALTGECSIAVDMIKDGITAARSTGANLRMPWNLSCLARAHVGLGQLEEARRAIGDAMTVMEATKEIWQESDLHRIAGDFALLSPEPDAARAQAHFERALAVARQQKAKSWELRAAISLSRLWRDQGRDREARDLLAPILEWFTEGFDTPDYREAKAQLS